MEEYIKKLFTDKEFFERHLAAANVDAGTKLFRPEVPWFYSGSLFDVSGSELRVKPNLTQKVFFLAENPQFSPDQQEYLKLLAQKSLVEYIEEANNKFVAWHRARPSVAYDRTSKIVHSAFNPNTKGFIGAINSDSRIRRYEYAHEKIVVLDWYPFYSDKFSLRQVNNFGRESLERIIAFLQSHGVPFLLSGSSNIQKGLRRFHGELGLTKDDDLEKEILSSTAPGQVKLPSIDVYSNGNGFNLISTGSFSAHQNWGSNDRLRAFGEAIGRYYQLS
jgi:hypothetical protein